MVWKFWNVKVKIETTSTGSTFQKWNLVKYLLPTTTDDLVRGHHCQSAMIGGVQWVNNHSYIYIYQNLKLCSTSDGPNCHAFLHIISLTSTALFRSMIPCMVTNFKLSAVCYICCNVFQEIYIIILKICSHISETKLVLIKTKSTRNSKCKYKANNRIIMHTLNYRVKAKYIDFLWIGLGCSLGSHCI